MLNKTLMIAATAAALMTGSSMLSSTPAEAGAKFSIHVGYGHGHGYYHKPACYTKYRSVRIKVRRKYGYGWYYKWIKKPYTVCPNYRY